MDQIVERKLQKSWYDALPQSIGQKTRTGKAHLDSLSIKVDIP